MAHWTGRLRALAGSPDMLLGLALLALAVLPGVIARNWVLLAIGILLAGWIGAYYQRAVRGPQQALAGALVSGDGPASGQDLATQLESLVNARAELERLNAEREETRQIIERLLRQMTAVARGDLATRVDVVDGELAQLASSFNQVVDEMSSLVERISLTSGAVDENTGQLTVASSRLTSGVVQQSALLDSSSERLEELRASLERMSVHVAETLDVALKTQGDAQSGNAAIHETMQVMHRIQQDVDAASAVINRLGESSRQIGAIVQFIAQIARQTNTLALNASIQAARAGEHGRGFAVVAEEVRTLAERSGNATRQIGALVSAIQADSDEAAKAIETGSREVSAGVRIVVEAAETVRGVDDGVRAINGRIQQVGADAQVQVDLADAMSGSVRQAAEAARALSEDSTQASATVDAISSMSQRLRDAVAVFAPARQTPGLTVVADGDD